MKKKKTKTSTTVENDPTLSTFGNGYIIIEGKYSDKEKLKLLDSVLKVVHLQDIIKTKKYNSFRPKPITYKQSKIIAYIEIIRIYFQQKENSKSSKRFFFGAVKKYNDKNTPRVKYDAFMKFKRDKLTDELFLQVVQFIEIGKTNEFIFEYLNNDLKLIK